MAPFHVAKVEEKDLPAINDIMTLAFVNNPRTISWHIFPRNTTADISAWRLRHAIHSYKTSAESRYYKLVDEATGKIVAYTVWQVPRTKGSEEEERERKKEEERTEAEFFRSEAFPDGVNVKLLDDFRGETQKIREKYVDVEKDYILKLIGVLPEYQGQGCGRLLMQSGLNIVDAAGARAELEATPQGKLIYRKFGFREVDEIVSHLEKYGGEGTQITTCMIRDAQTTT